MDVNLPQTSRFSSFFYFSIFLFSSLIYGQATVLTDRDDYVPGQYVVVTGSGWFPGETVQLHFDETPQVCTADHNRYTIADENGNINYAQFLINERHLGVTFLLTATGETSGFTAQTIFTDGNVRIKTSESTASLTWNVFSGGSCSGSPTSSGSGTATTSNGSTFTKLNNSTSTSLRVEAAATAANGSVFSSWSGPAGEFTVDASNPRIICIPSTANNGIQDFTINYISCISPTIGTQPINQTITYGSNANFSVVANGSATLSYQWRLSTDNGLNYNNIPGANTSTLSISNPTVSMSGNLYRVVVTNGCGSVTSTPVSLTVNKADANISVSGYSGVFDAATHGASGLAIGIGGVSLTGLNLGNSYTNVPGGIAHWTFSNPNYLDESGDVAIVITKADANVTVNGYSGVYDAQAHGASGSATGVGGVALTGLDLGGSFTDVPGGTAHWTFSNPNYEDESGDVAIVITKADANVTVSGYSGVYDAQAHGASGSATGVGGVILTGLDLGASFTDVPGGTAHWTFSNPNYEDESGDVAIVITKADANVTVNGYSGVYDAQAHGASGSATGVGGVALTGLDLGASFTDVPGGTAHWTFSNPNYEDESGDVAIVITKADANITVNGYSGVYDAQAHGASGSATGVGGVALTGLDLGASFTDVPGGTAHWTFSNPNYEDESGDVAIVITKADANITVNGYSGVYDAQAHGASGSATGVGGVALTGLDVGASFTDVPGGTAHWTFSNPNYEDESGDVAIVITKADANVTVNGYSGVYDAQAHGASGSATGVGGVVLTGLDLGASFTDVPGGTAHWTFSNPNYEDESGDVAIVITKADANVTVNGYSGVYDAQAHGASGSATGVGGVALTGLDVGASFTDVPGGTAHWTFSNPNYEDESGDVAIVITKASTITLITISNAVYDGLPHGGSANVTGPAGLNQSLQIEYTGIGTTLYGPSNSKPISAGNYSAKAIFNESNNYLGSSDTKYFAITPASTVLNLQLSASSVRYMDNLTFTAKIIPLNSGSPLTGSVKFTVEGLDYGTFPFVPIPGAADGSVQAMVSKQIMNLPGNYIVKAEFISTNSNYSGSYQEKAILVIPRNAAPYNATGYYTGDLFTWTTGPNTSTATLTMSAVIKDNNIPKGDVRGAKVSFYLVSGTTMSPIPSAQNLPVGLVDVSDGSYGSASAIVQLNIGSANAASFQIAVKVSGAYENNPWSTLSQCIVTVSKPVPGGYIVGGGNLLNSNSSGYVKGANAQLTGFQFDVQFNNKLTNPQGKAMIYISSYNKSDGTLDNKLHTYIITTNAISLLNITLPKAQFSCKANIVEQLENGTIIALEGGAAFQMSMTDNGNSISQKSIGITLNRKAGGIWFSSNWNLSQSKTIEQLLNGGSLQVRTSSRTTSRAEAEQSIEENDNIDFSIKVYPNPTSNVFQFEVNNDWKGLITVKVFDLSGRFVQMIERWNEKEFSFGEDLPSGIYLAIIEQGKMSKSIKIVKQ